jgi:DNA-binding NtrC family response regulator
MQQFRIFVVEDDPWYGKILEYQLSQNPDHIVTLFTTGKECIKNLSQKPDLVSIDYSLPDIDGVGLLKAIKDFNSNLPVVVISGQEDVNTALNLLKKGATEYLTKDDSTIELLLNAVKNAKERQSLRQEVETLKEELGQKYDFRKAIIGNSEPMVRLFSLLEKAANTNINVYITGDTGTGKEVVAKAIHYNSDRKKKPFVAVNMAAIPRELVESELFGYEKGAFTGAQSRKIGKFEEANKGTIFLDEIAELDLSLQSKLLRVLQERELTRVGGQEKVNLDVRLVVATHKNLPNEIRAGRFREDLFYRIMGLPITLPQLRERGNDILLLARHFLDEFCKNNKMQPITITTQAKELLMKYPYPGNVRELKSIIDLAAVMCSNNTLDAGDIFFTNVAPAEEQFSTVEKTLKEYTREIIQQYLKKYNNNVVTVARKLGIGKSTIYKMVNEKEITLH